MIICLCFITTACVRPAIKPEIETKPNIEAKPSAATKSSVGTKSSVETKPSNGVKLTPTEANSASEFLKFAESFSDLSAPAQKQALTSTNQVLLANSNDLLHRMKLVMIYGLPSSSLQDSQKAQNLLQQVLQENILLGSQQAFAHVMFDYIVALNKRNKSTQNDDKLVEQLQSKLEATQQKLEATQQKMNELKNIEKSMGEREILPKEPALKEVAPKEAAPKK
jgi:vacuolar-type H+-ATPase catalytic subunit A/Vma1